MVSVAVVSPLATAPRWSGTSLTSTWPRWEGWPPWPRHQAETETKLNLFIITQPHNYNPPRFTTSNRSENFWCLHYSFLRSTQLTDSSLRMIKVSERIACWPSVLETPKQIYNVLMDRGKTKNFDGWKFATPYRLESGGQVCFPECLSKLTRLVKPRSGWKHPPFCKFS